MLLLLATLLTTPPAAPGGEPVDVAFETHDGLDMYGKLTLPDSGAPRAVVVDADRDGKITRAEYEADAHGFRANVLRGAAFELFDVDKDGLLALPDLVARAKPLLGAIEREDYALRFKDHFAQPPIWDTLAKLEIPVGFFHGALDTSTPIAGVEALEAKARAAGKKGFTFEYFPKADHTLDIARWFTDGTLPDGHAAIFAYIDGVAGEQ